MNEPNFEFIDAPVNGYDPRRKTIILDKKLSDYPGASRYIKQHEYRHFEIDMMDCSNFRKFWLDLKHEFLSDFKLAFSSSRQVKELREYKRWEIDNSPRPDQQIVNLVRVFWAFPFYIISDIRRLRE